LTATATNTVTGAFTTTSAAADNTYSLTINGAAIYTAKSLSGAALTGAQVTAQINLYASQTGVNATWDSVGGNITLSTVDGRDIIATETLGGTLPTGGIADAVASPGTVTTKGTITLSASDNIVMTGAFADLGFAAGTIAKDANTINGINVLNAVNATDAMKRIDSALQVISGMRADLGATLNRFSSTTSNLSNVLENVTAAHSRIMDADFAEETANITKSQILQQAGISVLAQANTLPQNVLTLLRQ
jgi:flagellin